MSVNKVALPDIEEVSARVHAAWIEAKQAQGVTSHKSEDGEELMVPYKQLSEQAKEFDRRVVRTVYSAIQQIVSISQLPPPTKP